MASTFRNEIKRITECVFGRTPESYGQDKILRAYAKYPKILPLNVQIQHGWYSTEIPDVERINQIAVMLVWSKRIAAEWKKATGKDPYIIGSPFILYREMHGLEKKDDAKGTVAFPNHSTPSSVEKYDVSEYCQELDRLPDSYKPVTVCLHFRDVQRYGGDFTSRGYEVVTAGDSRQRGDGFVRNYYDILSRHRYSCSNDIGSYTFYSIEMGIPFFICGPESTTISKTDTAVEIEKTEYRKEVRNRFREIKDRIDDEQRAYALSELGVDDRLSYDELRTLLFDRFFSEELPRYPARLVKALRRNHAKLK